MRNNFCNKKAVAAYKTSFFTALGVASADGWSIFAVVPICMMGTMAE